MAEKAQTGSRTGAIARARDYLLSGAFEKDLARRVTYRTESQLLPASLPQLETYLNEEMVPAFERMGFTCRIYPNPIAGQGPVLLATRIEDPKLPTVLGYGHGDVVLGMDAQWSKGEGPWTTARDGDRLYGRGTADNKGQHTINMAALESVLGERGGRLGFNAKFMIEMGEESGSKGLAELIAANREDFAADVLIASDGPRTQPDRPSLTLGCRGAMNFDLVCELREGGHHSGNWGGLIANPAVILSHAIASIIGPKGELLVNELKAPPISKAVREALADVAVDGGEKGPKIDAWWGEPGHTPAERVYGANVLNILAFGAGMPGKPVNAIPPKAVAHCQLRFVAGTDMSKVRSGVERHLKEKGFDTVRVMDPPGTNDGTFAATRTEPDNPWVVWAVDSIRRTADQKPAVVPQMGGSICNDIFTDLLGMPTLWVPHSYGSCSQHAPDEHILMSVSQGSLELMAGIYWDLGEPNTPARD